MKFIPKRTGDNEFCEAQCMLNRSRRYNSSAKLKAILRDVYSGLCVYCESRVEHNSFSQIEHFYPKTKYKTLARDYRNLHYCCQRCNNLKGSKDPVNIFSPNYYIKNNVWNYSTPNKIEDELVYCGPFLFSINKNGMSVDRGKHTIDMFDLNARRKRDSRSSRRYLLELRIRECNHAFHIIAALYELLLNYDTSIENAIHVLFAELFSMIRPNYPYSTMIIHNYGLSIISLIKIFAILKHTHT